MLIDLHCGNRAVQARKSVINIGKGKTGFNVAERIDMGDLLYTGIVFPTEIKGTMLARDEMMVTIVVHGQRDGIDG
jgi:hypothetical protein